MSEQFPIPTCEWEILHPGVELLLDLNPDNQLDTPNETYSRIRLSRDSAFQIVAIAEGTAKSIMFDDKSMATTQKSGELAIPLLELETTHAESGAKVVLRNIYRGRPGILNGDASLKLHFDEVTFKVNNRRSARHCSIWILNGPGKQFPFNIVSERSWESIFKRQISGLPQVTEKLHSKGMTGRDSMMLPPVFSGGDTPILSDVPKEILITENLRPAAIRFGISEDFSKISWESLDKYLWALNFALGRRTIAIGYSIEDENGALLFCKMRPAWANNIVAEASMRSTCPSEQKPEAVHEIASLFLDCGTRLNVVDTMWSLYMASIVPMEAKLSLLATGLENLMNNWFKSQDSRLQGRHLDDRTWKEVSEPGIKLIERAIPGGVNSEPIVRRLNNANLYGVNEKLQFFCEDIQLPIGQVEKHAFRERNKGVHRGTYSPEQHQALFDTVRAFETLINRAILRIIGFDGVYVDYSTYGYPLRDLAAPLQGPRGDGKPADL